MTESSDGEDTNACPWCGAPLYGTHLTDPDARGDRPYRRWECGTFLWDDEGPNWQGRSRYCHQRSESSDQEDSA